MNEQKQKKKVGLLWGVALTLMAIGVFVRIPQVMPKLAQMGRSETTIGFVKICFYIMGIILLGGGVKKIISTFQAETTEHGNKTTNSDLNRPGR